MKAEQVRDVADVCRMLADQTRASIVAILAKGSKSVGMLCRELKLPQPTTSHHLALLRMSGLAERERKGKQIFYSLNRKMLAPVKQFLAMLK
jgi:ArsR family transcriptional regulator